ncbi:MAG: sodium:solute symporter family transporter [Butyricicoccus sp.]
MNFLNSYSFVAISFVLFTGLVAFISWWKTRGDNLQSESGYYLAGHSLPAIVVAGSLVMTDLSAEQLVGNNGQSVRVGITTFATQGLSWSGLVIAAVLLLPVFLKHGMTTLPEFFEKRYDATVRRVVSIIMLLSFILIMLPTILYAGAQVFVNIFHVDELFGISTFAAVAIMCVLISIVGSIYAIFGGLKAIAVSDTLNGVGMLICGMLVPILGLVFLSSQTGGSGSLLDGLISSCIPIRRWSMRGANRLPTSRGGRGPCCLPVWS